ncbi:tryptophan 2,3-dioxygenase family protein [Actinokineospora cianjurensis]|uniref:Tryptophan 2,3-dioxygenase n=1 Tax=Actinokineospora cianjurensis TaxID=585224 RepID=A0A421B0X3_9PSEU|nr:tryptophan 2,3-dioxygenase family protein [Actinokineospora cianjurensis]RLK58002.1 tryptophan 2,3-dioxygenase [Actinokineospora cianjurensis]
MHPDTALHTGLQRLPGSAEELATRLASTALSELTRDEIDALSRTYDDALAGPSTDENETLRLLTRPFSTRLVIPEYYRYTALHVHDWFIARQDDVVAGCLLAAHATLAELARIEHEEAARHTVVPEHIAERIRRLESLIDHVGSLAVTPGTTTDDLVRAAWLDERKQRQLLVLKRCCGLRRSDKHDEHAFIRAVLACELAFYLVRHCARRVLAALRGDRSRLGFLVGQVAAFADLINRVFHMLKTLSPELFLGFRDATGDASALQSLNYHLMELVLYGYDERKLETYTRFAHLDQINNARLRELQSLRDAALSGVDSRLTRGFAEVEQHLLVLRGRHYGLGRTYLPDIAGSGGTDGAAYLKRYVDKTGLRSGDLVDDADELITRYAFC